MISHQMKQLNVSIVLTLLEYLHRKSTRNPISENSVRCLIRVEKFIINLREFCEKFVKNL